METYRDIASGKIRGRWTYLGRVGGDSGTGTVRRRTQSPAETTRFRLLEALERLLEREEFATITAGRVADEAGVAHGTFYRYFKDKRAAFSALYDRAKEELDRERPSFATPLGPQNEERERVRRFVEATLRNPIVRSGSLRAWHTIVANDPEFRAERNARRAQAIASLADYLARLDAAGITRVSHPFELASALGAVFEGILRIAVLERRGVDETMIAGALELFERGIFGTI